MQLDLMSGMEIKWRSLWVSMTTMDLQTRYIDRCLLVRRYIDLDACMFIHVAYSAGSHPALPLTAWLFVLSATRFFSLLLLHGIFATFTFATAVYLYVVRLLYLVRC